MRPGGQAEPEAEQQPGEDKDKDRTGAHAHTCLSPLVSFQDSEKKRGGNDKSNHLQYAREEKNGRMAVISPKKKKEETVNPERMTGGSEKEKKPVSDAVARRESSLRNSWEEEMSQSLGKWEEKGSLHTSLGKRQAVPYQIKHVGEMILESSPLRNQF